MSKTAFYEAVFGGASLCSAAAGGLVLFAQAITPDPGPWVDAINVLGFPVAVAATMLVLFLFSIYTAYRGGRAIVLWGRPHAEAIASSAVATLNTVKEGSERIAAMQEQLAVDQAETKRCAKDGLRAVSRLADAVELSAPQEKRAEVQSHTAAIKRILEHYE